MGDNRDLLITELVNDIVGPRKESEELPDAPVGWYISGILFPQNTLFEPEDDDPMAAGQEDENETESASESVSNTTSFKQNSIGIASRIKREVGELTIEAKYGVYFKKVNEEGKTRWVRTPVSFTKTILLDERTGSYDIQPGNGRLMWTVESTSEYRILTAFLYNNTDFAEENRKLKKQDGVEADVLSYRNMINTFSIFQPVITVRSNDQSSPFSAESGDAQLKSEYEDESEKILGLLFRNKRILARGFNCAAEWDESDNPLYIRTSIVPVFTAKAIRWSSQDQTRPKDIDMKALADAKSAQELKEYLSPMADLYEKWIQKITSEAIRFANSAASESIVKEWAATAQMNIARCTRALERIRGGISLLEERPDVFEAFKFSNRAMLYQRSHYDFALAKFRGARDIGTRPETEIPNKHTWRPFQIAFILMNLRGIAERSSPEREIADLLWFPTGGGKTEAYLGLSAFAMALRRIDGRNSASKGNGVSVIMRYTLRLLTIQQFQRAAALVCACEILRREDVKAWGSEPFLIGLWVGYRSTPNDFETASKNLRDLQLGKPLKEGNPVQLSFCPWCGSEITHRNFYADPAREWIVAHCSNSGCDFYHNNPSDIARALPVLTVDNDIYKRCPAMVIGTVDKFARMPWRPQSSAIFGFVNRHCPRHGFLTPAEGKHESSHADRGGRIVVNSIDNLPGPDLVIQDELHLIAGPLGTMVGLYESAVEYLSSRKVRSLIYRPKVIVSTATVKGVEYQVKKLFNRHSTETFPPPGINGDDSFFWWEVEEGAKKFVGVSGPSYSMKTSNLRIYASILQKALELKKQGAGNIDPYWTLVGYFNSRRELGGSLRLLEDDVVRRIDGIVDLIEDHKGFEKRIMSKNRELTGRIDSSEIPMILSDLENTDNSGEAIDVLLATNMISVGVDVNRLGLMVVTGQPKNTAEYIQAVGRVGRRPGAPGLIITLYNPYRPRDLSHYENFVGYHSMLQRFVDPVSLTPFSDRALDRALHAVLIAMIRLKVPQLSAREDARQFNAANPLVKEIISTLQQRYIKVESRMNSEDFSDEIKKIVEHWERLERKERRLTYTKKNAWKDVEPGENILMKDVGEENEDAFLTPSSMRDVEKEAHLFYY
jgi:hypothetical protein